MPSDFLNIAMFNSDYVVPDLLARAAGQKSLARLREPVRALYDNVFEHFPAVNRVSQVTLRFVRGQTRTDARPCGGALAALLPGEVRAGLRLVNWCAMAPREKTGTNQPPQGRKQPYSGEQTAVVFAAFLVIAFILANMLGAFQSAQAASLHNFGWNTGPGLAVTLQFATYIVRSLIAALYFLKVRWFYWMLVASMVAVYCIPAPRYPITAVNTPGLIGLVILIGIPLVLGQRQYIVPWRHGGKRKGPA